MFEKIFCYYLKDFLGNVVNGNIIDYLFIYLFILSGFSENCDG